MDEVESVSSSADEGTRKDELRAIEREAKRPKLSDKRMRRRKFVQHQFAAIAIALFLHSTIVSLTSSWIAVTGIPLLICFVVGQIAASAYFFVLSDTVILKPTSNVILFSLR